MIPYFKNLEHEQRQYLDLFLDQYDEFYSKHIDVPTLPNSFYERYASLFSTLSNIDVLFQNTFHQSTPLVSNKELLRSADPEVIIDLYKSDRNVRDFLTEEGKNRLDFLVYYLKERYDMDEFYHILVDYIESIFNLFLLHDEILYDKQSILEYLINSYKVAKYQKKLSPEMDRIFHNAIEELENFEFEFFSPKKIPETLPIPNCWFITPMKYLYNPFGPDAHKGMNLRYSFYDFTLNHNIPNHPINSHEEIQKIKKRGYITGCEYECFFHFKNDFVSIPLNKSEENRMERKCHDAQLLELTFGILSAHESFSHFFWQLYQQSSDYERDLEFLKTLDFDEFLIRCCGFHKVLSVVDKTICTSCVNYEEEFCEYIKKGWRIDFVPPYIIDHKTGILMEYPEDFLICRKLLKDL